MVKGSLVPSDAIAPEQSVTTDFLVEISSTLVQRPEKESKGERLAGAAVDVREQGGACPSGVSQGKMPDAPSGQSVRCTELPGFCHLERPAQWSETTLADRGDVW